MGLRFRKNIKILPGVKLNIGKKSAGVSVGTDGARYSVNSSGRKTSTVGVPGTGLSYVKSSSSKKGKGSSSGLPWRLIAAIGVLIFLLIGGIAACTDPDDEPTTTTTAAETTTEAEPESKTSILEAVAALTLHEATTEAVETATEKATEKTAKKPAAETTEERTAKPTEKVTEKPIAKPAVEKNYILNTSTMKFHLPSCASCKKIDAENKKSFTGDRADLISQGYSPCGNCHP